MCELLLHWPKEAMNRPIWARIVDGAKIFSFLAISILVKLQFFCLMLVPIFDIGRYGIYS